ncbi:MAG: GGDEF domain-containing protein, partial [Lachnospiraceae bacterium]|nr:GGDEF domain-containing protein [Lachnospiraceae bacterium]
VSNDEKFDLGEYEYIRRMDVSGFDAFILYACAFYNPKIRDMLVTKLKAVGKPIISIDSYYSDFINVTSCNREAMTELVEHLILEHGVKKINYVSGPVDSNDAAERLIACRETMGKHGLHLDKERIYFGNYYVDSGYKAYEYFKANDMMDADAFVCANDQNAMGIFYKAEADDYRIPDDFIITGFDYIPEAAYNDPSITSVERFERSVGRKAYGLISSRPEEIVRIIPRLAVGGSCCRNCKADTGKREEYLRRCIKRAVDVSRYTGYVNDCAADFMTYRTSEEMYRMLPDYQKKFSIPVMSIVLDRNENHKTLDIPYHYNALYDEQSSMRIRRSEIYNDSGNGNFYVYTPLHYGSSYFGYVVSTNYFDALNNELYHMLVNNISNMYELAQKYSEQERYISKLKDLSYYDPLTKLYNRLGFFNKAEAIFDRAREDGLQTYIIFADLDGLKIINDSEGHKSGDEYLVDFADILSEGTDEGDVVMRFGGDEFVVFGITDEEDKVRKKIIGIQDSIAEFNKSGKYSPHKLGVSMGYTIIEPDTQKTLFKFIEDADGKMYKVKREKNDRRTGKDRRSGNERRVNGRRSINGPVNLS